MQSKNIHIKVLNTDTVLVRIIQTIKRRRINIRSFFAEQNDATPENATVKLVVESDAVQIRLLVSQLKKIIDVADLEVT